MSTTAIEWATHVWNPFTGCDRVSPGCAHCYAIPTAAANQRKELGRARKAAEQGGTAPRRRYENDGDPRTSGPGFGFTVHWDKLAAPERFPAGARVFVNSMSDVFHEAALDEALVRLWAVFASRPDVQWLVLTKRAERMREKVDALVHLGLDVPTGAWGDLAGAAGEPLRNVWLGVTVENRRFVHRAELLRQTPAAVRFVSAELLGPLTDGRCICCRDDVAHHDLCFACANNGCSECGFDEETLEPTGYNPRPYDAFPPRRLSLQHIDWLIVGGESGPQHRRVDAEWIRDLRDVAQASGTAFFFKQWGGRTAKSGGRELDGRTWDELPSRAVAA